MSIEIEKDRKRENGFVVMTMDLFLFLFIVRLQLNVTGIENIIHCKFFKRYYSFYAKKKDRERCRLKKRENERSSCNNDDIFYH